MSGVGCRMSCLRTSGRGHHVVTTLSFPIGLFWSVCLSVCSKTAEGTNFKFGRCVPRDSPDMSLTNIFEKWAWLRSLDPVNFGALDANSSKTAEDTNFKSGRCVPRDSPDMSLTNIFEKWAWLRSRDPVNFGALNANSSRTAEGTKFNFGRHVLRDSPDMTRDKCFRKVGVVTVT